MNQNFATTDQIKLLKHSFFQHLVTEIQSPLDLLQEYRSNLLDQYGEASPCLCYPTELREFVSLLQNAEARFILQHLAGLDSLVFWGTYVPYNAVNQVVYALTEPNPYCNCAYILHEDQRTGLLWIDWTEAEDYPSPDTDLFSIEALCRVLSL